MRIKGIVPIIVALVIVGGLWAAYFVGPMILLPVLLAGGLLLFLLHRDKPPQDDHEHQPRHG